MTNGFLYIDVETQRTAEQCGGFTIEAILRRGVAVAVTWRKAQGGFRIYREQDCPQLIADIQAAECVVGFNCLNFDFGIIGGHVPFTTPRTLDLLGLFDELLGFSVGLDALAKGTLGRKRFSDGNRNTALWKTGNHSTVERNCQRDVSIIRSLHDFILSTGWLAYIDANGQRQGLCVPYHKVCDHTR